MYTQCQQTAKKTAFSPTNHCCCYNRFQLRSTMGKYTSLHINVSASTLTSATINYIMVSNPPAPCDAADSLYLLISHQVLCLCRDFSNFSYDFVTRHTSIQSLSGHCHHRLCCQMSRSVNHMRTHRMLIDISRTRNQSHDHVGGSMCHREASSVVAPSHARSLKQEIESIGVFVFSHTRLCRFSQRATGLHTTSWSLSTSRQRSFIFRIYLAQRPSRCRIVFTCQS